MSVHSERSLRTASLWALPILSVLSGLVSQFALPSATARAGGIFDNVGFYVPPLAFAAVLAFGARTWNRATLRGLAGLALGVMAGWTIAYLLARGFVVNASGDDLGKTLLMMGWISGATGALIVALCLSTLRSWPRLAVSGLIGAATGLLLRSYHDDNSPALFVAWQVSFGAHYAFCLWRDAEKAAPRLTGSEKNVFTVLDLTSSLRLLRLSKGVQDTLALVLILWLAFVLFTALGRPALQIWGVLFTGRSLTGAIGGTPEVLLALLPAYVGLILLVAFQLVREHILLALIACAAFVGLLVFVPAIWPLLPVDGGHFAALMLSGAVISIIVAIAILGLSSLLGLLPLAPLIMSATGRRLFVHAPIARSGGRYPFWPLVRAASRIVIVRTALAYFFFAVLLLVFTAWLELSGLHTNTGDHLAAIAWMAALVLLPPLHWLVSSVLANPLLRRSGQAQFNTRAKWTWILAAAAVLISLLSGFLIKLVASTGNRDLADSLVPILSWGLGAPMATVALYLAIGIIIVFFQGIRSDLKIARERIQLRASDLRYGPATKPVLFLRSFSDDEQTVGAERPSLAERFLGADAQPARLEEVLADEVFWRAPLVALADPRSGARPLGAARDQVADADWQDYVQTRIREFGRIVLCLGSTPNLKWEVDEILDSGSLQKAILVLPADPEQPRLLSAASPRLGPALGLTDANSEEKALQGVRCICFDGAGGYTAVKTERADAFSFRHALRFALQGP